MDCYICTTKKAIITYKSIPYCDGCMPKDVKKQLNASPPSSVPEQPDPPNPYSKQALAQSDSHTQCTGTCDPGDTVKVCTSGRLCILHKCDPIDCFCK